MSKIAIFSDVHGNLPALKTVLNDIDLKKADQVYCLGDLMGHTHQSYIRKLPFQDNGLSS